MCFILPKIYRLQNAIWMAVISLALSAAVASANIPGGGNGTGANVTLVNNGDGTVTMANAIVSAQIKIATAQILQLTYNGVQVTDGSTAANGGFYWQGPSGSSDTLTTIVDPSTNGGNFAEIRLFDSYTNNSADADACRYFTMFRGSPGIYVAQVMHHTTNMPAGNVGIPSFTGKLGSGIFNWLAQDTGRNQLMQSGSDTAIGGINSSPKEVRLLTSGQLAGQFECKYDFSGDLGALGFSGWCSTNRTSNFGIWMIHPSNEYFTDGPMHKEILAQMIIIQSTFTGVHYGFHPDMSVAFGEDWAKVNGPFFIYFNKVAPGTANPQTALYADAMAQTAAEREAWPYSWFNDSHYVQRSGRGKVAGRMVINDRGNPNASASNLWVGLTQQPASTQSSPSADFQLWGKNYQYWTKTDASGNFVFSNVIAGANYTLFAFGPGTPDQFQSQPLAGTAARVTTDIPASPFSVTVNAGETNGLGNVTWTPTRVGATVWQIGVPDRDTTEFRHGDDYWHGDMGNATNYAVNWMPWQNFRSDFPNGVNYVVSQSHWAKDWDYSQGTVLNPATGNYDTTTWTISFNLPQDAINNAPASIYFGIAASYAGPVVVKVNGADIAGSTGFFPAYSSSGTADQAMIRMGSHGIFCDHRIDFSSSLLHAGANTITLHMRKGGYFSNMTMYDYIRLELAGYVPPAPGNVVANAGDARVALFWPAVPGATGYNILRSTTSGSGYSPVATNIVGPVSGSVDDTAAFTDTNALNGQTYYYIVQSRNPNGTTNSVPVSATPSAATPPAPNLPMNVVAAGGNNQVTLHWNASSGADRYIIRRTVLTIGAVTTYTPGGINPYIVINSYVTGTNYTDTALANNVTYSYQVRAVNPNGQSAFASAVNASTAPLAPAAPTGLAATVVSNQVMLFWSVVSDAANYIVSRATSPSGPYTVVDNPEPLASFIDSGLNYNTTYYYEVASANLGGISTNSLPISKTTTPAPPSSIVAVPGNKRVSLIWTSSPGATTYVLQRSTTDGGSYSTIYASTNTSYINTGLNNGTTYYYVVYAVGPNGTSPLSAQVNATPFAGGTGIYWINSITTSAQDWNADTNWSNLTAFPNATQAVAVVNSAISANQTIDLNQNITVGELDIGTSGESGAFNVAGNGATMTLDNLPSDAALTQLATSAGDTILAPMTVNGGLVVSNLSASTFTLSGNIAGATNGVTLNGNVTLNGANTFGGGTFINASSVVKPGSEAANTSCWGSGPVTFRGGTLQVYGYGNSTGHFGGMTNRLMVPYGQTGTLLLPGRFGYYSPFTSALAGAGTLNVTVDYVRDYFSGDWSAFTGLINVSARSSSGDFRINNSDGYANAALYLNNGVNLYNINANNQTIDIGELDGASGAYIGTGSGASANPTWRIGARNTKSSYAGVIADSGVTSLIKTGAGALILSGANTYSGGTTINDGTVQVNNLIGSGTGSGVVIVNSGGTLGGNGTIYGSVSINSGGALLPGVNGTGTLTLSNSLSLAAGSVNKFAVNQSPLTNAVVKIIGILNNGGTLVVTNIGTSSLLAGDTFHLFDATSYSGSFAKVILPPLSAGLTWDTTALNSAGTVSVIAVSKPVINSASILSGDLIFQGNGGVANGIYYLLGTTNLATPLTNWTRVKTNQFDAAGHFIFTNPLHANKQQFYRLQIP